MGKWRDRIVHLIPTWVVVTLAITTMCGAMVGWCMSAFSVVELVLDGVRLAFEAIGLGILGPIVWVILMPLLCLLVVVPLLPAMASFADRPDATVADAKCRLLRMLMVAWATFIIQMWVVPPVFGEGARVQVCTPVRDELSGFELSFFAFGVIEGHVWLLVVMWEFMRVRVPAAGGTRLTRAQAGWEKFFRFMWRGALAVQVLIVVAIPAAVPWWIPVGVCPDPGPLGECMSTYVRGLDIELCEYPTGLVLALYGNIAASLAARLWDSWRGGGSRASRLFIELRSKLGGG